MWILNKPIETAVSVSVVSVHVLKGHSTNILY